MNEVSDPTLAKIPDSFVELFLKHKISYEEFLELKNEYLDKLDAK